MLIAQSVDNLGGQFRPAMRAGWFSYIRRVYREEDGAAYVGLVVGEGTLVIPTLYATFGCGIMRIIEIIIAIIMT